MNACACGCGATTRGRWANGGHKVRVQRWPGCTGRKGAIPFERVAPLLRFLVEQDGGGYGSVARVARSVGMQHSVLWKLLNGRRAGVTPDIARRIVRAVKDIEENWRLEAYREHERTERAYYRAKAAAR